MKRIYEELEFDRDLLDELRALDDCDPLLAALQDLATRDLLLDELLSSPPLTGESAGDAGRQVTESMDQTPRANRTRGRRPVRLEPKALRLLDELVRIRCSTKEIAGALRAAGFPVSERTLYRKFGSRIKAGRKAGNAMLRQAQWKAALGGNVPMLIWLGKQELGQRDKHDARVTGDHGGPVRTEPARRQVMLIDDRRIEF